MATKYLSCAETAKLLRAALKRKFPAVKFGIRSKVYSGGASIRVSWTNGPTEQAVDEIAHQFAGGGFDGSIDMAYHVDHWLLPDGSTVASHSPGTEGSRGYVPRIDNPKPHPDAIPVSFGANFIFCDRDLTDEYIAKCEAAWSKLSGEEQCKLLNHPDFPRGYHFTDNPGRALASFLGA